MDLHCFQKHHVNFSPAAVAKAPLVEVIQMLPAAPRWVCTLFNEQRKQPARKWGLEDPLLHIKDTINWGQMKQCAGVCVYCVRVERHEGHYHKSMPLAYVSTYISIRLPWNQTSFFWIQFTWFLLHRIFFLTFFYIAQWWQPRCNCDHLLAKCYFINTPECRSLQFYFPLLCLPGICSVICLRR